jgi:hypothetical protein
VELPIDETLWASGAGLAQKLASCDQADREKSLAELGKVMCAAYEIDSTDAVFGWWLELALRALKP